MSVASISFQILRYFYEEFPDLHVIAAGSLLEFAMRNLDAAKVIQLIYPTTDVEVPVKPDLRKSPRLQFPDTGLINNELGIQPEMLSYADLSSSYKGAIVPHLITQELISLNTINDKKPNFWIREKKQSSSKIDLVFTYRDMVIPIEIKSANS